MKFFTFWYSIILFSKYDCLCQGNIDENCFKYHDDGNIQLLCPQYDTRIHIEMDPEKNSIRVECYEPFNKNQFNSYFHMLPKLNLNTIDWIGIYRCNLENTTVTTILHHLNINNTRHLTIDGFSIEENVTSNSLDNQILKNLESLKFTHGSIKMNIIENMTKLKTLELRSDEVFLNENSFKNLNNIEIFTLEESHKYLMDNHHINDLPSRLIGNLRSVLYLSLRQVRAQKIFDDAALDHLGKLKVLHVFDCQIQNISKNIFESNNNLTILSLRFNHLKNLPENLFENTAKLTEVCLSNNKLENLPANLFRNQRELVKLDLSKNNLDELPQNLLNYSKKIQILKLNDNNISIIHMNQFEHLNELIELKLENNNIQYLSQQMFDATTKLKIINLNNNLLSFTGQVSPFGLLTNLEELHLANNDIKNICMDWYITHLGLKILDLSHNKISSVNIQFPNNVNVDLNHNNISEIQFFGEGYINHIAKSAPKNNGQILLSNNPIKCDCKLYSFYKAVIQEKSNLLPQIQHEDLYCNVPNNLKGTKFSKLHPKDLKCPLTATSVNNCAFEYRVYDKSIIINCSNNNLKHLSNKIPKSLKNLDIVLFINNNNLTSLDMNFDNNSIFENVKEIYAFNNKISEINFKNLPKKLEILQLHNNLLQNINTSLLSNISSLRQLTLHQNPWDCYCDNKIVPFVQKHYKILENLTQIKCAKNVKQSIFELTRYDICYQNTLQYELIIFSLIILCVMFITLIFYYKYKLSAWNHDKYQGILSSYTNASNSKLYDIFIIYSTKDVKYLTCELLPKLQNGSSFRLFLLCTDSEENVYNLKSIQKFIDTSHKTICILSDHFIDHVWNHCDQTVNNTIFINTGENPINNNRLKCFINLKNYIEYNNILFWDKVVGLLKSNPIRNQYIA